MRGMRKRLAYGCLMAAALAAVFWLGRTSGAQTGGTAAPGSPADPLVARSFVDGALNSRAQDLENRVQALQARVEELTRQVALLEQAAGSAAPGPAPQGEAPSASQPAGGGRVKVKGEAANLRGGPGTQFNRVAVLPPGTEAEWVEKQNGWYRLRLPDGREGWVLGELVEELR